MLQVPQVAPGWTEPATAYCSGGRVPVPVTAGSQVYVRGMARALVRRGHRVTVAWVPTGLVRSIPTTRCPHSAGSWLRQLERPDPSSRCWMQHGMEAARIGGDIVHAHNYEVPLALPWPVCARGADRLLCPQHDGRGASHLFRRTGGPWARPPRGALARSHRPAACRPCLAFTRRGTDPSGAGRPWVTAVPPGIDPHDVRLYMATLPPGPGWSTPAIPMRIRTSMCGLTRCGSCRMWVF